MALLRTIKEKIGGFFEPTSELRARDFLREIPSSIQTTLKSVGSWTLDTFAPIASETIKKIGEEKSLFQAYKEVWQEATSKEKKEAEIISQEIKLAEERGASKWELAKIMSKSPMMQRAGQLTVGFMGGMRMLPNHKMVSAPAGKAIEKAIPQLKTFLKINPKVKSVKALYDYLTWTQKSGYIDANLETSIIEAIKRAGIKKLPAVAEKGLQTVGETIKSLSLIDKITPIISKEIINKANVFGSAIIKLVESVPKTAIPKVEEVAKLIPKELEPLATEARKYKSAEEFIEGYRKNIKSPFIEEAARKQMKFQKAYQARTSAARKKSYDIAEMEWEIETKEMFGRKVGLYDEREVLTDFYNQAVKGVKEVLPKITTEFNKTKKGLEWKVLIDGKERAHSIVIDRGSFNTLQQNAENEARQFISWLKGTTEYEQLVKGVKEVKAEVPTIPPVEIPPIKPPIPPSPPPIEMPEFVGEPVGDPIAKLNELLKAAKPLRGKLEKAYTAERTKRIAEVERFINEQIDQVGGEEGYAKILAKLKGELVSPEAKIRFEPIKEKLTEEQLTALFKRTWKHPYLDNWEKISAADGLMGLLGGEIPQPKQLVLLEEIYGTDLIKNILSKRLWGAKATDFLIELANLPRAILATADMSAFLRQGIIPLVSHPLIGIKAAGKTFQFAFSPKSFEQWFKDLPKDPLYSLMRKAKLNITDPSRIAGGLARREEPFISRLLQNIPVIGQIVKFAERSYVGFLNKLRVDIFKTWTDELLSKGFSPVKDIDTFKAVAKVVNTFTGRGGTGTLERVSPVLNTIFFSPRLIAARFNTLNPVWYARMPKEIRKKAISDFAKFVGVGLTTLGLIYAWKKANNISDSDLSIETDLRSSDAGKIRIGNTRFDIWGGFQQWARVFAQVITGERKNTATGEIVSLTKDEYPFTTRKEVLLRFIEGKLAPVPALINELISGAKTFTGEDITFETVAKEKFIPMYIQDIAEAYVDGGLGRAVGAGVAAFFGVGVQTWEERKRFLPPAGMEGLPSLPMPGIKQTLPQMPGIPSMQGLSPMPETKKIETPQFRSKEIVPELEAKKESLEQRLESIKIRSEKISKAPSEWSLGKIKQRIINYFNEVPLLQGVIEAPIETALKKEAIERYPTTEIFKDFAKDIYLQTDLPKEEPTLGLISGRKPYAGISKPRSRFQSLVAAATLSQKSKTQIEMTTVSNATVMHEMLHSWLYEEGLPLPWKQFSKDWVDNKKKYPILQSIDFNLFTLPLYKEAIKNEDYLTEERFAWLGEMLGGGGIKNIPLELREYYKDVFK